MGWRKRQARQPERNIKLISVLQFSVLSFKKRLCVFVSVSPMRTQETRFKPGRKSAISTEQASAQ